MKRTNTASNVISRLESTPNILRDNWVVPREVGRFLYLLVLISGAKSICEVGTSIGYSTLWLASAAKKTGGTVNTLEYFEKRQQQARLNIDEAGLNSQVSFYLGDALDILRQFDKEGKSFDFVFLDASKREYIDYIKTVERIMPPGALLVADNSQSHRKEMQDFLDYMEESPLFDIAELETHNGQLLARKVLAGRAIEGATSWRFQRQSLAARFYPTKWLNRGFASSPFR